MKMLKRNSFYIMVIKALPFYLFIFFLFSCGSDGRIFRLQGRLRNLNQGEFLIYSPDGGFVGVDTIKVRDGGDQRRCHPLEGDDHQGYRR